MPNDLLDGEVYGGYVGLQCCEHKQLEKQKHSQGRPWHETNRCGNP